MATEQLEYEVHEQYKSYSIAQLNDAPITCFQGVNAQHAELLKRYFEVTKVSEMAGLSCFQQALAVQKVLGENAANPDDKVITVQKAGGFGFKVRQEHATLTMKDLLKAPVHVLDNISPSQDLALYNTFRITSVKQLAENRIMLEARVIAALSEKGDGDAALGGAGDMEQHVQSRISAMSSRLRDEASKAEERNAKQEDVASRAANIAQRRVASSGSRLDNIMASRGRARSERVAAQKSKPSVVSKTKPVQSPSAAKKANAPRKGKPETKTEVKPKKQQLTPAGRLLFAVGVLLLLALVIWAVVSVGTRSEPEPVPVVEEVSPPVPENLTLRLVEGDTLWEISARELRDGERWPEIFEANQQNIRNPDLVYPNQEITIPGVLRRGAQTGAKNPDQSQPAVLVPNAR